MLLVPIESVHDPRLVPALRVYHESFPLHEQMSVPFWFETVLSLPLPDTHLLAVVDDETDGATVGMVFYQTVAGAGGDNAPPVALLWYLCTRGDRRGAGLGAAAYQTLVRTLFANGIAALVFEVEIPEEAGAQEHGGEAAEMARRRIAWYRRNGARVLEGVRYLQSVDNGSEPTPMHLMVHTPAPVTPDEAYALACAATGEEIERVSELSLA
ncbi:MAG TPA: GNAT family N-acetyltransferase [Armatimonadaceae bacterium]|nr:GNAT family N-acetyltransferase [Armatimonadaceae bacterium]